MEPKDNTEKCVNCNLTKQFNEAIETNKFLLKAILALSVSTVILGCGAFGYRDKYYDVLEKIGPNKVPTNVAILTPDVKK